MVEDVGVAAMSETGTLAYISEETVNQTDPILVWVNLDGKEEPLNADPGNHTEPSVSPDGNKVALHTNRSENNDDIWTYDLSTGSYTQLSTFEGEDRNPVFDSNGEDYYYLTEEKGSFNVFASSLSDPSQRTAVTIGRILAMQSIRCRTPTTASSAARPIR